MKLSYLIKKGIDHLVKHGDGDIKINLLTENQSNFLDEEFTSIVDYNGVFEIEVDIENKKKLMSKIK